MSNPSELLPIVVREVAPGDLNFVLSSWKGSLKHSQRPRLPEGEFYRLMNTVCEEVLSGCPRILVACSPLDPHVIMGWLCAEATAAGVVLWMCCVHPSYQREKIAKRLFVAALAALDGAAGPRLLYCASTRFNEQVEALGAEHLSWAKALRLRGAR